MTILELHQVRRDLNFESETRFNLFSVMSVVDAYIGCADVTSVGIYARKRLLSDR